VIEGCKLPERRSHMNLGHQVLDAVPEAFNPVQ
jgi:hypothetical protein